MGPGNGLRNFKTARQWFCVLISFLEICLGWNTEEVLRAQKQRRFPRRIKKYSRVGSRRTLCQRTLRLENPQNLRTAQAGIFRLRTTFFLEYMHTRTMRRSKSMLISRVFSISCYIIITVIVILLICLLVIGPIKEVLTDISIGKWVILDSLGVYLFVFA